MPLQRADMSQLLGTASPALSPSATGKESGNLRGQSPLPCRVCTSLVPGVVPKGQKVIHK